MVFPTKKVFVIVSVMVVVLCVVVSLICPRKRIYETNSISDYGRYVGNYDNDTPSAFINSFFPSELSEDYSEVEYHYKSKRLDTYSYEVYLGFCITDSKKFNDYLEGIITKHGNPIEFIYNNTFEEINVSNVYNIASNKEITGDDTYRILNAQVGKILISRESQRIIFVAIGLHDGGGTDTSELSYFFNKFNINPCEYTHFAYDTVFEEQSASK